MTPARGALRWASVLVLAIGAIAIIAAGACGEKPGGPAAPPVVACNLFTAQDAEQVLGEPPEQMTSVLSEARGGDPATCGYNAGSDTSRMVSLEVRQNASPERARRQFESARGLLAGSQQIGGLGEAAFWVGRGVDQLHVLKGDLHLIVTSHPGPQRDAQAAARTVAGRALSRV
jgi:hypothetical protein